MSELKLYFAATDALVSLDTSSPVLFPLNIDLEESDSVRLYAKCDVNHLAKECVVTPKGTSALRWQLAPDVNGSEGVYEDGSDPLILGVIRESPVYFWAKTSAVLGDIIERDQSVVIDIEGIISVNFGSIITFEVTGSSPIAGVDINVSYRVNYVSSAVTGISPDTVTFSDNHFIIPLDVSSFTFYDGATLMDAVNVAGWSISISE